MGAQDPGNKPIKSPANSLSVDFGPTDATPTSSVHIDEVQGEPSKDLKSMHDTDLQAIDESAVNKLVAASNGFNNILSDMQLLASDDTASASDTLKAAAKAMSLTKDRFTELQLRCHFKDMLLRTVDEVTKAEKYVHKVEGFISEHGLDKALNRKAAAPRRKLSSNKQPLNDGGTSTKYHFHPGVSKADFHHRAKSRHLMQGHRPGLGNSRPNLHPDLGNIHPHLRHVFGSQSGYQEGYHGARALREEGRTTHRRLQDDTNICLPASRDDRKIEQCYRLAKCAENYGLYDMFTFFFGDNLDFAGGNVLEKRIQVEDEVDIDKKVRICKACVIV